MALDLLAALLDVMTIGVSETRRRRRIRVEAGAAWDTVATALDVELEDAEGEGEWKRFTVDLEDVHVTVEHTGGVDGETRVGAKAAVPSHERLQIYRSGRFSPIARAVGFQDVPLGDPDFDDAYIIKANDPVFARTWANSLVRGRITRAPDYRFELKSGRVKATRKGLETDAKSLRAAVRAVAAFADGRHQIMKSWGKLTKRYKAKLERNQDRWAVLRGKHQGVSFSIDTHEHADRHYTVVAARAEKAALDPFVLAHKRQTVSSSLPRAVQLDESDDYAIFSEVPQRVAALFDEETRPVLSELGISKIEAKPQRVKIFVPGICVSRKSLSQMVSLATKVAQSGELAPYR